MRFLLLISNVTVDNETKKQPRVYQRETFKWLILVFPVFVRELLKNDACSWFLISVIDLQCIVAPKEKTAKSKEMFLQLFIIELKQAPKIKK